jgi:hypothetical protein
MELARCWNWPDNPPHTDGSFSGISKPADLVPGDTLERITSSTKTDVFSYTAVYLGYRDRTRR